MSFTFFLFNLYQYSFHLHLRYSASTLSIRLVPSVLTNALFCTNTSNLQVMPLCIFLVILFGFREYDILTAGTFVKSRRHDRRQSTVLFMCAKDGIHYGLST